METYLFYIGKAAIAAGAFYIAFLLLFQNQKHFTFNRIYLPVSLALSFVIPLITFTTVKYIEPVNFDANSFAYLAPATGEIVQPAFVFEWYHYLFGLYLLGTAGFLFHLLLGHLKAINIIQKSRIQKIFNNLVNITPKDVHPFSFFSKIVVSEKTLSHPDLEMIVSHENIHVREKHTLDILFTEIMFLLQWFNPFAWLLKDAVKNNLEYITDNEIAKHYNPQTYQLAMVTLADKQGIAPFLTALNGSQLKNRIVMMKKKTENKYAFVKQLLVLPLLAVLVMGLSNREVKTEVIQKENQLESNQLKNDSLKMNNKEFMSQLYHDGLFELQDYGEGAPLIFLNGKEVIEKVIFDESDFKTSQILPPKEAVERFGERGENGAMIFETKTNYLQKEALKGKVTNEKGEPLVGASVIIKGNNIGTITDTKGNYEIRSESEMETLIFAMTGYEKQEIKVGDKGEINVKLKTDANAKPKEIEVVGYGSTEKKESQPGGFIISGGMNGTMQKGSENVTITPSSQNGITIKATGGLTGQPTYFVDGVEATSTILNELSPDSIESISVLKDKSANALYGEKGKNGVILITTKKYGQNNKSGNVTVGYGNNAALLGNPAPFGSATGKANQPLILVNGKESGQTLNNIDPATIESVNVLKDKTATQKYGEKGKNGVILINTKTSYNSEQVDLITIAKTTNNQGDPILYKVDTLPEFPGGETALRNFLASEIKYPEIASENGIQGKVYVTFIITKKGKVTEPKISRGVDPALDKEALRVVSSLPDWKPGKQKGEAVNVSYTVPVYFELEKPKHNQTYLELRKKIAQSIKYPVVAQENNQQGVVEIWAYIQKDGTISRITDKKPDGKFINIDEVVVTALKSEKAVTSEKSKNLDLLVKESKRVIEQLSPFKVPELLGEMVCFRIKFVLQ
jgi:TonB family protein